jgi:DNA segregation ATPase FtsK/SpoIIIE-like protein
MSHYDDPGDDMPTESMIQNWNEANDHADETPHHEDNVEQPIEHQLNRLAATLSNSIDRLEQHIEERAAQLAAPRIAEAEQRATTRERAAEREIQRAQDLITELRRQVDGQARRADQLLWLSGYLPEPLRQLAGHAPARLANQLDQEWLATVARRASPTYNPEAEAQLRLLTDAITFVVKQQLATPSILQRKMKVDYATARQLLERMEHHGVVSHPEIERSRARDVLITPDELPALLATLTTPGGESAP